MVLSCPSSSGVGSRGKVFIHVAHFNVCATCWNKVYVCFVLIMVPGIQLQHPVCYPMPNADHGGVTLGLRYASFTLEDGQ
jgi:chloramphenicol 3-O-phosphotransferase